MSRSPFQSQRGTVLLVALCFVTVLGISLAGYIAVCSRTMQLSNRTFQTGLSQQLAEMGLEEAMRAFNKNNWSDWSNGTAVDWTLDTTNKRATATVTFPAGKFGQGVTGSVKIRVDNYDAANLGSTWSSSTAYRLNELVGYNGTWYRSLRNANTGNTPGNLTWWAHYPVPWTWSSDITYALYDVVNYNGVWYRCISAPPVSPDTTTYAPQLPIPATAYWVPIPSMEPWAASTSYAVYDVVSYNGGLYRCTTAHTSSAAFSTDISNWSSDVKTLALTWSSAVYTRGAIAFVNGTWYYCIQSGTSSSSPNLDTAMWAPFWVDSSGASGGTNPSSNTLTVGVKYVVGDYVYYSSSWRRCITAHTHSSWAADSGKWTTTTGQPIISWVYRGAASQTSDNVIYYGGGGGGSWYRYAGGWILAMTGNMHLWSNGSIKYNLGDAVYYTTTSRWYRCILAHTSSGSINPSNTAYWATTPLLSNAWDPAKEYNQFDTVCYKGVWYLSLQNSNYGQVPPVSPASTGWWVGADTTTGYYAWSSATAYSTSDTPKAYGGAWYKCLASNTGQTPNNSTYWTTSWAQTSGVTTGSPVVYAEGTIDIAGSGSTKTQLRATVAPMPLFSNAAAATDGMVISGGAGTVDSYDGSTYAINSGGIYTTYTYGQTSSPFSASPNWNKGFSAVLAAGGSTSPSLTIGSNTDVKGYAAAISASTSPYAPLISYGGSATVKGASSAASPNVDTSRISRSPYIPQFDILPTSLTTAFSSANFPSGTALSLGTTTTIGTPGAITPSRYYYNGNLSLTAGQTLSIEGPVILYINGYLRTNTGTLIVNSTGSAEIHFANYLRSYAGSGGFINRTKDPKKLVLIGDAASPACYFYPFTDPLGLDSTFYGVVYLPNNASGFTIYTGTVLTGAVSAKSITFNSEANLHYDTSLRYATIPGMEQPYGITTWRELDGTERITMP